MKICNEGTEPKQLRVCDLEPGTVFRLWEATNAAVRLKLLSGDWCSLETGRVFDKLVYNQDTPVVVYPNACLQLGDPANG